MDSHMVATEASDDKMLEGLGARSDLARVQWCIASLTARVFQIRCQLQHKFLPHTLRVIAKILTKHSCCREGGWVSRKFDPL